MQSLLVVPLYHVVTGGRLSVAAFVTRNDEQRKESTLKTLGRQAFHNYRVHVACCDTEHTRQMCQYSDIASILATTPQGAFLPHVCTLNSNPLINVDETRSTAAYHLPKTSSASS